MAIECHHNKDPKDDVGLRKWKIVGASYLRPRWRSEEKDFSFGGKTVNIFVSLAHAHIC